LARRITEKKWVPEALEKKEHENLFKLSLGEDDPWPQRVGEESKETFFF
jgi:hypothetical protein